MLQCNVSISFICLLLFLQPTFSINPVHRQNNEINTETNEYATNKKNPLEAKSQFDDSESFKCFRGQKIISQDDLCNGVVDCPDLSDECFCENPPDICARVVQYNSFTFGSSTIIKKKSQCGIGQVDCGERICIERSSVCDGRSDCPLGIDEEENLCSAKEETSPNSSETETKATVRKHNQENMAPETTNNTGTQYPCVSWQTKKQITIDASLKCNFVYDCEDGSDERNCNDSRFFCEDGQFPFVVPREKVGNNMGDCPDWSDECPSNSNNTGQIYSNNNIIANPFLRALVWIMGFFAIAGNLAVMIREVKKIRKIFRRKMHGPAFANHLLILNLSFSDFLMGVYLLTLGIAGLRLSGVFCQRLLEWCSSTFCEAMGSLAIIASEASVVTMVMLTSFRLYTVFNPFSSQTNPKLWMTLLSILVTWTVSFLLALIPLSPSLETTFVPSVLIRGNPIFNKSDVVVTFDEAKKWAERALTYDPYFTPQTAMQAAEKLQRATSYGGLQAALGDARSAKYLEIDGLFGFYSSHSVCIPRFLITKDNGAWVYSIAITTFNFVAFVFVAVSYLAIAYKAIKRPTVKVTSGEKSDAAKKARIGARRVGRNTATMQWKIFRLIATDFCCWVPISILAFLSISGVELDEVAHVVSAVILLPINSALNPILYSDVFGILVKSVRSIKSQESDSTSSTYTSRKISKGLSLPEAKKHSL